jgi:para-aminobenzoate synthetase component 1
MVRPDGGRIHNISITDCYSARERARMGWRLGDPGDPAELAASFLAAHGLILPTGSDNSARSRAHVAGEVCGAAILVSAAAGAVMVGGPTGPTSPAPGVPDVAVVVYVHDVADSPPRPPEGDWRLGDWRLGDWRLDEWQPSWSGSDHAAAVAEVRAAIARGDVYQVNVVGHASAAYHGDPRAALRRVTSLPGAHYAGLIAGDGWAVASGSPEMLVRVEAGVVETRPIKGTRAATAAGRRELLASAKERAEHVMIVDLERNDLAHVARTGTVDVPELFAVRRWCDLWQAESRVVARLADGVDLQSLLRAVCPGGSVTGAPKLAALGQIAALEPVGRGPSMGALGWLDSERLTLGLTIRTVAVDGQRVHLWTGGGITWDSDPYAEVAEAAAKAAPVRAALAGADYDADPGAGAG